MIVMPFSTRPRPRTLAILALAPLLTACGIGGTGDDDENGVPQVVTAIYPLQYVAERVAGDRAEILNLTSPGVEAHDLELDVRQVATLSESDLVVYLQGFQPAVDEAVEQNGPDRTLEVSRVIDLAPISEDEHDEEADADHDEDSGETDHEDETDAEHAEHTGDGDPHFWLDPQRLGDVAAAVARELSELDPDNAPAYERASEELRAELSDLDDAYAQGLADCRQDTVVVSHDAFGYLERHGLHFEAIAGLSPDSEPSPAHLAELQDLVRDEGITTVFAETLSSPALSESLARDLGLETDVLDPIEGLTADTEGEDYLSLMRANLEKLQRANGCR